MAAALVVTACGAVAGSAMSGVRPFAVVPPDPDVASDTDLSPLVLPPTGPVLTALPPTSTPAAPPTPTPTPTPVERPAIVPPVPVPAVPRLTTTPQRAATSTTTPKPSPPPRPTTSSRPPATATKPSPPPKPPPKPPAPPPPAVNNPCSSTGWGLRPHAARAAHHLIRKFGIAPGRVGGYRPNAVDATGHPAGLAVDLGVDRATGDRMAAYLIQHWATFNIKYVIWFQRINYGKGWSGMESRGSITADHRDHLHLQLNVKPGPGLPC